MRFAGSSEDDIAGAKSSPWWLGLEVLAHTLAYDAACMGDYHPPTARLASITQPTLVLTGEPSMDPHTAGLPADFFQQAADAVVASVRMRSGGQCGNGLRPRQRSRIRCEHFRSTSCANAARTVVGERHGGRRDARW
jgi:hypothetical protein